VVHQAGLPHHGFPGNEDGEVRNAANVEARRKFRITFRIYLDDDGFARHVFGSFLDLGRSHFARPTPFCPEISEHGNAGILRDLVELFNVNLERFVDRRQAALHWPQRPVSAGWFAGMRFLRPQTLHGRMIGMVGSPLSLQ